MSKKQQNNSTRINYEQLTTKAIKTINKNNKNKMNNNKQQQSNINNKL